MCQETKPVFRRAAQVLLERTTGLEMQRLTEENELLVQRLSQMEADLK